MKVSKEEIVGMVKAVELLRSGKRNRDAEDAEWRAWFRHITEAVSKVPGASGEIIEPKDKQYYPMVKAVWDPNKIGITAGEVGKLLLEGEPRIMTHAGLSESSEASEISGNIPNQQEAAALRLQGTQLVVLSACETALGEVRLRRWRDGVATLDHTSRRA